LPWATLQSMDDEAHSEEANLEEGLRSRGEQAVGDIAQALLENPVFNGALSAAFGAREKALEAQQSAMGALNLPRASVVERLERRLRSLSQRLEAAEEEIDRMAREAIARRAEASKAAATTPAKTTAPARVRSSKPKPRPASTSKTASQAKSPSRGKSTSKAAKTKSKAQPKA